ncbi:cytochrome d ubiquinol oxidase subunit 2 [Bacillus sp. FJAT-27916]|uniref:cytochrome d ubiquinol oxidase subunit II n=1 Tax=Bacillaceae TaxID=186817 RepID=UPI000670A068|nr:cytochrome d ubiquinol oxidase subunit II [Bacillus sp. FJAT-27916]KMY43878.1 cytochrome d ubiquinol oxidase subunit 2 [Bacillus sp. FJAT-27916]
MSLNELWFLLVAVLFIGFFILEGFDFGVGMSTRFLARDQRERDQLVTTIGPFWDANEVWLITAGGAIFAAFPEWYATMFSGYYLPFVLFLLALIVRGVAFEFRHKVHTKWTNLWDWMIFIGSIVPAFVLGVLFTSLVRGMPIDASANMYAGFTDYFNLYSIVGGIAMVVLCFVHGLTYIGLRTEGPIRKRAQEMLTKMYILLLVGLIAFAVLTYFSTDLFEARPVATPLFLFGAVLTTAFAYFFTGKRMEGWAFTMTTGTILFTVTMLFVGLFPRVMISSISSDFNLTIINASSSPYTLKVMTIVSLTLLPFVLGYQIWSYYVFRKRVSDSEPVGHE